MKKCSSLRDLIKNKDWSETALGAKESWPNSLRIATSLMLDSQFPMFLTWGKERVFLYNDAYAPILGEKHPAALGQTFYENWSEIWDDILPLIEKVDRGEAVYLEDLRLEMYRQQVGHIEETYFTFSYSPIRDEYGEVCGLFCACVETTNRIKAEKGLEEAKENAEAANLAKSNFLAHMSHEIRTPMNAILGFTEVLQDSSATDDERTDALERIRRSGKSLLRLIDDVLDISKVEAGKVDVIQARFSPEELVREVVSLLRFSSEPKGLQVEMDFDPSLPKFADSDAVRIRQILINLIGNAIKFTSEGEVRVTAKASDNYCLVFQVKDTGIGIPESDQRKLFQPFTQADGSITRNFGGTGLGLVLSKRLAENLGGSLGLIWSRREEGSTFELKVPASNFSNEKLGRDYELVSESEGKAKESSSLVGVRVLVAEDLIDNRKLIGFFLKGSGASVDFVNHGKEAITKAMSNSYDIILMDIQMPFMSGIEATESLRKAGYVKPIVALTAHALPEEIQRSKEAGCTAHLTKPIGKKALIDAIKRYGTSHSNES